MSARVCVIVDTSGSMDDATLNECVAECEKIIRTVGMPVDVLAVDTAIRGEGRFTSTRGLRDILIGGGGTRFASTFERLARESRHDVVIALTDGEVWDLPSVKPGRFETVWCLRGPWARSKAPAPWGVTVRIPKK